MSQDELFKIILAEPGISIGELKDRVDISGQTVREQVQGLIRKGLVRRETKETRRTYHLYPVLV